MSVSRSPRYALGFCRVLALTKRMMKTKKKRPSRRVNVEESDILPVDGEDQMQVDEKSIVPRPRNLDSNFVDDDELQAALARSRRAKLQKPKKLSPEEIAQKSMSTHFAHIGSGPH